MFGIKRNWIIAFFVTVLGFGLLGSVILLIPRQPPELELGEPDSFRFIPDPHLLLRIDEVSRQPRPGGASLRVTFVASNTAASDMTIDLTDLRLALVAADEITGDAVMPVWEGEPASAAALAPQTSLVAQVTLPIPAGVEPTAILIWEEYSFLRYMPRARGSILCPTLKLSLDEGGGVSLP